MKPYTVSYLCTGNCGEGRNLDTNIFAFWPKGPQECCGLPMKWQKFTCNF